MKKHLNIIYTFLTIIRLSIGVFASMLITISSLSFLYIISCIEKIPAEQQGQLSIAQLQEMITQSRDVVFDKGLIMTGIYFVLVAFCLLIKEQKTKLEQSQPA